MAFDKLDYYRKQVTHLRPMHTRILPGQDDLHVWAPVAGFDADMMAEVYSALAEFDRVVRGLSTRRDDIDYFAALAEKYNGQFAEARRQIAFGTYQVGLGLYIELKNDQTFKSLAPVIDSLEDDGWIVQSHDDDADIKWRTYKLKNGDRAAHLRVSLGHGERTNGCRIVPTGETKPVLKIVCDDAQAA